MLDPWLYSGHFWLQLQCRTSVVDGIEITVELNPFHATCRFLNKEFQLKSKEHIIWFLTRNWKYNHLVCIGHCCSALHVDEHCPQAGFENGVMYLDTFSMTHRDISITHITIFFSHATSLREPHLVVIIQHQYTIDVLLFR